MTTKEEYSEAAELVRAIGRFNFDPPELAMFELAASVLRQLADGAVLCREGQTTYIGYSPIEEQP